MSCSRRRARRGVLHLLEPREPRPAPARRVRHLGPRPARLLDPAVVARRDADVGARDRPRLDRAGMPDVAFIDLEFASGVIAHVELSWLAPSKLRRTVVVGSEQDGRLRGRQRSSRCGSSTTASSTRIPRRSASTTSPTARATSSRRSSTRPSRWPQSSGLRGRSARAARCPAGRWRGRRPAHGGGRGVARRGGAVVTLAGRSWSGEPMAPAPAAVAGPAPWARSRRRAAGTRTATGDPPRPRAGRAGAFLVGLATPAACRDGRIRAVSWGA